MLKIQLLDVANPLWQETLEKLRYDIYHTSGYVDLEAKRTQSIPEAVLIEEGEKIFFLPYLSRRCDSLFEESNITGIFDVLSPYG
ncbi:MAG: FemAB family protein, partial [Microcoleus sp. CAN_BIN18]|nr:FemAB family protein [Microcoleus sp. CAN_BIN18]